MKYRKPFASGKNRHGELYPIQGTPGQIRTGNLRLLKPTPLPIGLQGLSTCRPNQEVPAEPNRTVPACLVPAEGFEPPIFKV